MFRVALIAAPLLALTIFATLPDTADAAQQGRNCEQRQSRGRGIARGMLGGIANRALGRATGGAVYRVPFPVSETLTDAFINMLDCDEQRKAVEASDEAVRGGVGTTSSWTSDTRPGVSGSSTASGQETLPDGSHCMTVTDIIIVDGQETRAPKRMCRGRGQTRYVRV